MSAEWSGRRLHFIGIGGAGMSGLALVCARLGAEVSGSDRADSSYMERLRGAGLEPGDRPRRREPARGSGGRRLDRDRRGRTPSSPSPAERGVEPIHRGAAPRRALRREAADRDRRHPRQDDDDGDDGLGAAGDRRRPRLLRRRRGAGPWARRRGRQRRLGGGGVGGRRGRRERRQLPATATRGGGDHQRRDGPPLPLGLAGRAARGVRRLCRPGPGSGHSRRRRDGLAGGRRGTGWSASMRRHPARPTSTWRCRASTTAATPAPRWRRCSSRAPRWPPAAEALRGLPRRPPAPRAEGLPRRRSIYMTTTPTTRPRSAPPSRPCANCSPSRLIAVFQPHLYSRTKALAEEFGAALGLADEVVVLDVYPAREEPVGELAGVSGLQVARAAAERGGGKPVWWLPGLRAGAAGARRAPRPAPRALRQGDGAGDDRRRRRLQARRGAGDGGGSVNGWPQAKPPAGVERRLPAGAADHGPHRRARPTGSRARREEESLVAALRWAADEGLPVGMVGSGSNLLVADDWLPRARAEARRRAGGDRARGRPGDLPAAATASPRRRRKPPAGDSRVWSSASTSPGTTGGAVRMNANAYGGQLARVLEWVDVCTAAGTDRRAPEQLGFTYRHSNLREGEVVARASFQLQPAEPEEIKATLAAMRERRREAQPSGIKTFGSTFKNPEDERAEGRSAGQLLEAAGCRGLRRGGARFSEKHANFVENDQRRDHRRRARADGRGPAPGPRAVRRRARARGAGAGRGALAGGLGAVRPPADRGARRRRSWSPLAAYWFADPRRTAPSRRCWSRSWWRRSAKATKRSAVSRQRRRRPLAAAARRIRRCRSCRWSELPKGGRLRGTGARTGAGPGRRSGRPAPLRRRQLLRRERGGRRTHVGDRTALRRRHAGAAKVAGGGGDSRRSGDYRARLCKRDRAEPTRPTDGSGTRPADRTLNLLIRRRKRALQSGVEKSQPEGETGSTLK